MPAHHARTPHTHLDLVSRSSRRQGRLRNSCSSPQSLRSLEANLRLRPGGGRLLPPHAPSTSWHSPAEAAERTLPGPGEEGPPGQGRPRGPPPRAGGGTQTKLLSSTGCFEVATAAHSHLAAKAWLSAGRIVKRAPYLTTSTVGHNTSPFWTFTKEVLGFLFCVGYSGEI